MDPIEPVRPRRVYVDSGPATSPDDGERVIVFRVDKRELYPVSRRWQYTPVDIPPSGVARAHTTVAMSDIVGIDLAWVPIPPAPEQFLPGFEGSDLVAVYYALDMLGRVFEGDPLEVIGDGPALSMLSGKGKVSVRWGGVNWTAELVGRIREAEGRYRKVDYGVIASSSNPAGNLAKENKRRK